MYYFVISGIEILKFYLIFHYGFEVPKRKIFELKKGLDISTVLALVVWLSVGTITFIKPEMEHSFPFYISWIFLEVVLLCRYQIKKLLLLFACSVLLIGNSDTILYTASLITSKLMDLSLGQIPNVLASGSTLLLLVIAVFYIPKKDNGRLKQVGAKYFVLVLLVSFLNSTVIGLLWNFIEAEEFGKNSIKLTIICALIFVSVYFQIGLILKLAISNNLHIEKHQMNQYYLTLQEKHYLYLEQKERETKKFRHDIKSHMYTIGNLSENEEIEKLKNYVETIWGKIDNISSGIYINNSIVEAILNQYNTMCMENNIKLTVQGHLPTQCFIGLFDLCTVFSNLLQNAYEATKRCKQGEINLSLKYDDAGIYIKETNNCLSDERVYDEKMKTNKKDKYNHGFGTVNMQESINNYKGIFNYDIQNKDEDESWFTVKIIMLKQ